MSTPSPVQANDQIVLVTGANKGIGFALVRLLAAAHPSWTILLGSRSKANAEDALKKLPVDAQANVRALIIDVSDDASIAAAAAEVKRTYGRLDLLFDNAAIADFTPGFEAASSTMRTNVIGVRRVDEAFLPLMADNTSRIVIVSSEIAPWTHERAPAALREKLEAVETLQWKDLEALLNQFVQSTVAPSYPGAALFPEQTGLFGSYAVSKMFLSAYARALHHQLKSRGIPVFLATPGYCNTEMTAGTGTRSAEQGALSLIRTSERPATEAARLFLDEQEFAVAEPAPEAMLAQADVLTAAIAASKEKKN